MMRYRAALLAACLLLGAQAPAPRVVAGVSLLGPPVLPASFTHFPYVNPDAPKGGEVALAEVGTFDSFNPFIVRGTAPFEINRVFDSLLRANDDEAEAAYAHIAQSIELPADGMGVTFVLRPEARFHDGSAITAEDVAWSFNTLRTQARPIYAQYYSGVASVSVDAPLRVTFRFNAAGNHDLPLSLGQMAILSKAWWSARDFTKPLTEPPRGSGPYRVASFTFGRSLVLERVPNWWAENLPTAKGLANFDRRRTEFFRDRTVALEAFKAGQTDIRIENSSKDWATAYDFPAVRQGLVKHEAIPHRLPTGMQGYAMNLRRPLFQDRRVRQALALVFDFEWANKNLFYGAYTRSDSYFSNSDLASSGVPTGAELALLEPFRAQLPPELFTEPFVLPQTDGSGNNRDALRRALGLLKQAGWEVKDRKLVDAQGKPMQFEILLSDPAFERITLPYVQWLARLGVEARVRTVDPAQYQRLTDSYDYDMAVNVVANSDSPGGEQLAMWSCAAASQEGGDNLSGVCDPVVDALVAKVIAAPDRAALLTATHALDRVLLANWYMVPHWHLRYRWVAYWNRFGRPAQPVRTGVALDSWWFDPAMAGATDAARAKP